MVSGLYGLGIVGIIGWSHWFNGLWLYISAACLLAAGPLWKWLYIHRKISRATLGFLVLGLAAWLALEVPIWRTAGKSPAPEASYVLILGAGVDGTTPSLTLRRRIDVGFQYASDNPDTTIIACGGQGPGEDRSEAFVIERELLELGIGQKRILKEDCSTTTRENLQFAGALIEETGGSLDEPVVIVSSSFHLYRAIKLAQALGYRSVSGTGSASMRYLEPHYYAREAAALIKEWMDGHL